MPARTDWLGWLRRRRRWLIALALLIGFRLALPGILRRVAESQASKHLNAEISIGDIDLELVRGGIALKDVAVRARSEGAAQLPPLISWKRFAVGLRWGPLFRKTIQLREVVLESPRVALERLKSGDLNLLALLPTQPVPEGTPAPTPSPSPEPAGATASDWQFGADRIVLKEGTLSFADRMMEQSEPVDVRLDSIEVADISLAPGVYGEPSRIHVDLKVDESIIRLDARFAMQPPGVFLDTTLKADRFPLRRTRIYIPHVGWSNLQGEFNADVSYHLETGTRHQAKGSLGLQNLTVTIPDLEQPALAWRSLAVDIEEIDLLAHKATVPNVRLDGASVLVRPTGDQPLPVLGALLKPEPGAPPAASEPAPPDAAPAEGSPPAPAAPEGAAAAAEPPPKPWEWLVGSVDLTDAKVHALSEPPLDLAVAAQAREVSSDGARIIPIQFKLGVGEGSVALEGEVRQQPLGLRTKLQINALDIPTLLSLAPAAPKIVSSAQLNCDLKLAAGSLAQEAGAAEVDGTLSLAGLDLRPTADTLNVRAKSLDVALSPLKLRGALPESGERTGDLALQGSISLTAPAVEGLPNGPSPIAAGALKLVLNDVQVKRLLAPPSSDDDQIAVRAVLGIEAPAVTTPDARVTAGAINLELGDVQAKGLRAPASNQGDEIRLRATLGVQAPAVTMSGTTIAAGTVNLELSDVQAKGLRTPASGQGDEIQLQAALGVQAPEVTTPNLKLAAGVIKLDLGDVQLKRLIAPPAGQDDDVHLRAGLSIQAPSVTTPGAKDGDLSLQGLELDLKTVEAQGIRTGAAGDGGKARVQGKVALTKLLMNGADPKAFSVGANAIEVPFDDVQASGFFGGQPSARGLHVRLGDVMLEQPTVRVIKTKEGITTPRFGSAPPQEAASAPKQEPAPPSAEAKPQSPLELSLDLNRFHLGDGKLNFTDRGVSPFFKTQIAPLNVEVRGVHYPALSVKSAKVDAQIAPDGSLSVSGGLSPEGATIDLKTENIDLAAFNPYATAYSPYSISSGSLSVKSTVKTSVAGYKVDSSITLHDFDMGGSEGDSSFQQQFGIPLSVGLALLRDIDDNIVLGIPLETDEQGARVGIGTIVGGALRSALINALASPLKLAGALFKEGKVESVAPSTLAARPGRAQLTDEGRDRLKQLARLLASRPGMGVRLGTAATTVDARWLREQALRTKLDNPEGVAARLRGLVRRGSRDTILAALEARAKDEAGELDAETNELFEQWLSEVPAPSPKDLNDLAQARLDTVQKRLEESSGIAANRILAQPVKADVEDGDPQVRLELAPTKALGKASAPVAESNSQQE